jgi:peptidoglycan/xylan/chitin deacetylase (PgdA/CDA1 family)
VDDGYLTSARELDRTRPLRLRVRTGVRRIALTAVTPIPRARPRGIRIVHYHWVFDDEMPSFRKQVDLFASEYEPVSLTDAVARLEHGGVTGDELVITFDDGFRNQFTNAATLLRDAGFSACFFLITDLVGAPRARADAVCRERLHLPRPVEPMSWSDAAELLRLGHELGSHTRSHPDLATLSPDERETELLESRRRIDEEVGTTVRHLSAPYGDAARFTPSVSAAARAAGYATCVSSLRGINVPGADVHALRRDHLVAGWPVRDVRYFLSR